MTAVPTRRLTLLVGPRAGRGRADGLAEAAAGRLRGAGCEVQVVTAPDAAATTAAARAAVDAGTDALVAVGGDGMVHLALQLVAGTETPLGVLPGGTGNDVARTLGVPRDDSAAAVEVLLDGRTRRVDLGRTGPTWFASVLAAGFDSRVNARTNRMRWPRGRARYTVATLVELARLEPLAFTVETAEQTLELDATLVAVGNGTSYGGGMRICPDARLDDGLLDVTVVAASSRTSLVRTFPTVFRGTHVLDDRVTTLRTDRVRLTAPGAGAHADGEPVATLPVDVECVPRAVTVLVPR
ncbi:diacylglycerol kinase [Rhodococcus aerolatus]